MSEQRKTNRYEILDALESVLAANSRIAVSDVELFAPVYYPIALVELKLVERTFEDYETVHLTILRLVGLGIADHNLIAQTLGLSPNYVFKILRLLESYGHVSGMKLTALGEESLATEKKILTTQTIQKFQVDALNGTMLRLHETVADGTLDDKEHTNKWVGHLDHVDGISAQSLRDQLMGKGCEHYLRQKSGILHTNVVSVDDAKFAGIKYAGCYLLKLRGVAQPLVFAKRYDYREKDMRDRFSWQPFSVSDRRVGDACGFSKDVPIGTPLSDTYIRKLYVMLLEQGKRVKYDEELPNAVNLVHPFHEDGVRILPADLNGTIRVMIDEKAITVYRRRLVSVLCGIARNGYYPFTSEYLQGRIVMLCTESAVLKKLAQLLSQKVDETGKAEVTNKLADYFTAKGTETPVVEGMADVLTHM